MMKRFITAMLGSLAGIWLSFLILTLLVFFSIIVFTIVGGTAKTSIKLTDNSVLYIDLAGSIEERAPEIDLFSELYGNSAKIIPLNDILNALKVAQKDDRIKGLYLNCDGATSGIATSEELHNAIIEFQKSGKWVYAYADSYTQNNYYIVSSANFIDLNPFGSVDIKGLSATTIFFKGFLDKIGIEMQVVKVGTYKSAVEPYILTEMSAASRLQQEHYLGNIWSTISNDIANARNVAIDEVNYWADSIIVTQPAEYYVEHNIVDRLSYRHETEQTIAELCGENNFDDVNLVSPTEYCKIENTLNPNNSTHKIAVLYAVGDIVDQGDDGIVGRTMAPQILELAEDDEIQALVLRVNSGGGSAFASEQIWEALEQFKATGKKFYVSMGHLAASGGYYISCGADRIYADETTLTGSIGIFGVIPCIKNLLTNNLGITQGTVSTNTNSDFISLSEPMTPSQRNKMQRMINNGYETFVGRCANGRGMSIESIKAIAEGRVWDGKSALDLGLVDKIGGIDTAISDLASELGFDNYAIVEYPSETNDLLEKLLNAEKISEGLVSDKLGYSYEYYNAVNKIKELEKIQCRMEKIIIE